MLSHLAGITLLLVALSNAQEKKYMLTFPNVLRNGMAFQAHLVLLENVQTKVVATVSVKSGTNLAWTNSEMDINIAAGGNRGSSDAIMVPYDLPAGQQYDVHIEFTGLAIVTEIQKVTSERPNAGVLVQTDKPIYKPKDMVRYRVLSVDLELKPKNEDITVQIKDPKGDIIMQKMSGQSDDGGNRALLTDEFELSSDPPLGVYQLITMTDTAYDSVTFKVDEYVLPKFDVTIKLDKNFGVKGKNSKITGTVQALYSYGENVKGKMVLSANGNSVLTVNDFDGIKEFSLPVESNDMPDFYFRGFYTFAQSMTVEAVVSEAMTKNEMMDSETFTLYDSNFKATIVEPMPIHFDGMSSYSFQMKLTDPTGGDIVGLDLSRYSLKYMLQNGPVQTIEVIEENPITLTIDIDTSEKNTQDYPRIEVWYLYAETDNRITEGKRTQVYPPTYFTAGKTELEVTLKPGYEQDMDMKCFQVSPFSAGDIVYYQILDNYDAGEVLPYSDANGHCFSVMKKHTPKSMIVVYKVSSVTPPDMKEAVQDLVTTNLIVNIPWTSAQQVSLEVSPKTVEPGDDVTIRIQTSEKSYVALTATDKSLTFLEDSIDITQKGMRDVLESGRLFDPPEQKSASNPGWDGPVMMEKKKRKKRCFSCWNNDQYMDALTLMEESGLGVATNLYIYQEQSNDNDMAGAMMPDEEADREMTTSAPKQKVRKDFREVWLWQLDETDDDGSLTLIEKVPDVITNWITKAFAFNSIAGAGVAIPQEVTVLKDFFLSMNLPYSTVRGEIFDLQLVVFNYMSETAEINVELYASNEYTVLDRTKMGNNRLIVRGSSSGIVKIPIQLSSIGMVKLRAKATKIGGMSKIDIVERELLVKPEGREVDQDIAAQIKFPASQNEVSMNLSSFFNERNIVEDSLRMRLFVTGDMMGPVIASFESRIQMPYGCGEQNMQSLAPGLFSILYLKTIDRLEREIKQKAGRVCGAGYRKELSFKHGDGSYSAFGAGSNVCGCRSSDDETKGSTWLTGFVLKLFSLLYTNQMTYVDFKVLEHAFDYLVSVANPDCEELFFEELGVLIHTEMKGGTSSNYGFTAFILVAMLDFRDAAEVYGNQTVIDKANNMIDAVAAWLIDHEDLIMSTGRPYQMAITAYALAKASDEYHSEAEAFLDEANALQNSNDIVQPTKSECQAKPGSGDTCRSARDCLSNAPSWGGYTYECCKIPCSTQKACVYKSEYQQSKKTGATQIEIYGYTLMAALELDRKELADELSAVLLSHRKVNGFFYSTQDTTVALEALTRYSMKYQSLKNTEFTIKGKVDNSLSLPVVFTPNNYTVRTQVDLPVSGIPRRASVVVASGLGGTAYINLVATYNVKDNVTDKPLILIIKPGQSSSGELGIQQCVKRNSGSTLELSSMIVMNICGQSGSTFTRYEATKEMKTSPQKVEMEKDNTCVSVYYLDEGDEFNTERCLTLFYEKQFDVRNLQDAHVTAFDYYNPENTVAVSYNAEHSSECLFDCDTLGASSMQISVSLMVVTSMCVLLMSYLQKV